MIELNYYFCIFIIINLIINYFSEDSYGQRDINKSHILLQKN